MYIHLLLANLSCYSVNQLISSKLSALFLALIINILLMNYYIYTVDENPMITDAVN